MTYPIIHVAEDAADQLEQLGTKYKYWYVDSKKRHLLYKEGRPGTGENWSEKVACEICKLLGLPHAHYEFAEWQERRGLISETFVPKGARLIHGNELLSRIIQDYHDEHSYHSSHPPHTVRRVMGLIGASGIELPIGYINKYLKNAPDVFVGYLMLDALIANQDRHHENWGLIAMNDHLHLTPTYDHASSLGRNETDETRRARLESKDQGYSVEAYVSRAKSALYLTPTSKKPLTTIEAFHEAAKIRPDAGRYWLQILQNINQAKYVHIFSQIPKDAISNVGIEFALKMIECNTKKLLGMEI